MASSPEQSGPQRLFSAALGTRHAECPEHGVYESTGIKALSREIWSRCPTCEVERRHAEEQDRRNRAAAESAAKLKQAIGESGIPIRFQSRTFAAFVADTDAKRHALTVARDFAENFATTRRTGHGLVFAGLPGTGKSHLSASILLSLVPSHAVQYLTCMSLIRAVRDTWRRDSERSEKQVMRLLCDELDLLVIDEIGVQYGTDGEQTILFEVLDRRYSGMRPTILLTNQDKAGFKTFVGDRVFDRLVETSRWVAFDWPSHRAAARQAAI